MALTVLEAMKLEIFNNFRLLAGHRGLDRVIEKVGILDWELTQKVDERYEINSNFIEGEFVLSSLLFAKDKPELIIEAVKFLEKSHVSGLAIKNIYYNTLPDEVIQFATEKSFPIFIFHTVYFEDIITEITDKIRTISDNNLLQNKVDLLIRMNLNKTVARDIAFEINSSFKEFLIVVYVKGKRDTSESDILNHIEKIRKDRAIKQFYAAIKYRNGLLLIATFEQLNNSDFQNKAELLLKILNINPKEYFIGISNLHSNLSELGNAINESLFAEKSGEIFNTRSYYFSDIGVFSILIPYNKDIWVQDFYNRMIKPIINYDEKYHMELFDTALKFIENDGSITKTAEALFLHRNTVRYRIKKIKEIHHMEKSELTFYEQLSIAIKLYKIYSN